MRKLKIFLITAAAALLGACSGGSDNTLAGGGAGPGEVPGTEISTLTLLTSSPQIPSDGSTDATISALVRDSNNNVMEGVSVIFSADSGSLAVSQPTTTDASGVLTATLSTAGDPTARAITVSAMAGDQQASVGVTVAGVAVTIDGPKSLSNGGQGSYTVRVVDNPVNGNPVAGANVDVTSSAGNTLSAASLTTDTKGEAVFTVTAAAPGADSLTAEALGVTSAPFALTVSSDSFTFTTPDPAQNLEIALGDEQEVAVVWLEGPGQPISFSSSRGSITNCAGAAVPNNTVTADGAGAASLCVVSTNAGPAVITATNGNDASIQADVEFVAVTPVTLDLQASPFTVGTNSQSSITAVVRDATGNLVKNQVVTFVLDDVTGGSLSLAQSTTNSQGRAQTAYTSSTTTSSVGGVEITAAVQGFPAVTDMVALTVAQQESFVSLGTGNEIDEPNTAQYRKEWVVQVTDTQGNGVPNADVTFSILSTRYWDGFRQWNGTVWETVLTTVAAGCMDEDILTGDPIYDRNGILDPNEDNNGNGSIDAGNIASAAPQGGSGSSLSMDGNGFGIIDVYWPQEYAHYLEVVLEVRTSVQGSESSRTTTFMLDGLASDFNSEDTSPPGPVSPFGSDGDCSTPPPL